MTRRPNADAVEKLLRELDSYEETVSALVGLIHELSWDDAARSAHEAEDVRHFHGSEHAISGQAPVTPDLSVRVQAVHSLGDVKVGFASDEISRLKIARQLMKYDHVATEHAKQGLTAGTILLTHYSRKIDAADYFQTCSEFKPNSPFACAFHG